VVRGALILVLVALLFLHGAVPGLAVPTLGQAVWTTGFAQSFLNDSLLSVYATNFGAPQPAPISFGLAGAWPAAAFIAAGLHPADAYAAMAALWLSAAFLAAYRLSRVCGATPWLSIAAAALWLTMPIIWVHAHYSMVGLGMALLPLYFLCALTVFTREASIARGLLYLLACLIAAFMDGYSFVMFAAGSSVLGIWLYIRSPSRRAVLLRRALPVHLAGLGIAAALYLLYVGRDYERAPLEMFRAWGLDLAFLAVPTQGMHWMADLLGWSTPRSEREFFGDWSVWSSTFALPLLGAALWAWWRTRRASALPGGLLIVLACGLYMALGPALKIDARKPAGQEASQLIPAGTALLPTGSAWLSSRVPGLRNMRSAYRWLALAVFSGWLLLILLLSARERGDVVLGAALMGAVAVLNLPDVARKWREDADNRRMFLRIEAELVKDMQPLLRPRERVAFLPWGNDMMVNYLAARLDLVSYNIGGDKNLKAARQHWPPTLQQFREAEIDEAFAGHVMLLLARREADSVVLPYIDLLWAAHRWPLASERRQTLRPAVSAMRDSGLVTVDERQHYAVVRPNGASEADVLRRFCMPPICLRETLRDGTLPAAARPMAAGRYRFVVRGRAATSARIEVVSGGWSEPHASYALSGGPVLVDGFVNLRARVEDLAIRIAGGEGEPIRIDSYEIVPLGPAR
jgi:hypothetical protein